MAISITLPDVDDCFPDSTMQQLPHPGREKNHSLVRPTPRMFPVDIWHDLPYDLFITQ
jgi:hypothetical protein